MVARTLLALQHLVVAELQPALVGEGRMAPEAHRLLELAYRHNDIGHVSIRGRHRPVKPTWPHQPPTRMHAYPLEP